MQILGACLFFTLSCCARPQIGDKVTLVWNFNPLEDNVTGYFLYYGTVGASFRIDVGNTNLAEVPGLTSDAAYHFALSAYDQMGTESLMSPAVAWQNLLGTNHFPTASGLSDQTVCEGFPGEAIDFGVDDLETPADALQLSVDSSNLSLVRHSGIVLNGFGKQRTMTVLPEPGKIGNTEITLMVGDAQGATASRKFTYSVLRRPGLDTLPAVTLDLGTETHGVWLNGILPGAGELKFSVWSGNPHLIPQPEILYSSPDSYGWLVLKPTANAVGTAVITLMVEDSGRGNAFGLQTFSVTVRNYAPTLAGIGNQVLLEDAPSAALPFQVADVETRAENLLVRARSSNPSVISSANISIQGSGAERSLMLRPNRNQYGSLILTLTVTDEHGGVTSKNLLVTVLPVNDRPGLNAMEDVVMTAGWAEVALSGIHSGAANELQPLTLTASSDRPDLVGDLTVTYLSPDSAGALSLTGETGVSGTATITVIVSDGQAETSQSFRVTIPGPHNPPALSNLPEEVIVTTGSLAEVPFWVSDEDSDVDTLVFELASSSWELLPTDLMFIEGLGSERRLYVLPMPGRTGTGWVALLVHDDASTVIEFFSINVVPLE